jgi:Zn-dependent protease
MANRRGDPTARLLGRLTLNPLPHIDPIGTVALPLLFFFLGGSVFGWAKPVPVNERNLRNWRLDGLLVAAAGPLSNLLLALAFAAALFVLLRIDAGTPVAMTAGFSVVTPLALMARIGVQLNVLLAIFNLLPLPPLDGSRVLGGFFPGLLPQLHTLERFGFILILALLWTGVLDLLVFRPTAYISAFILGFVY